ncbi:MAG: SWIM zinc finger family protein [Thermomicrobiales bacterium]
METIPQLSEQTIRARFDPQSWQRGQQYARDGAIINARRQGMTLKASCVGSMPEPYRVEVTFDVRVIVSAECSCPVGDEGYCKHVAALLLTWLEHPEAFVALEDVDVALERRDKADLISLIKRMLQRHPDLDILLVIPESDARHAPVNPAIYRRQVATMLARQPYQWGDDIGIGWNLREMIASGDAFLRQGNYEAATGLYASVAAEIMEQYESFEDEEGSLLHVVGMCAAGLGECLRGEQDHADLREEIVEALFGIFVFGMEWSDLDLDESIPDILARQTTADEKRLIAEWINERLPSRTNSVMEHQRRAYGALLLDLEADTLDDEGFLRICRKTGRILDLVDRLLALGRTDEATNEAARSSDYDLLQLADVFTRHGQGEIAVRLMVERSETTQDSRILVWLKEHYKTSGDDDAALALAERLFRMRPGFGEYAEVRALATQCNRWGTIRPTLLHMLTAPQYTDLLLMIYLDEGEIDRAVTLALDTLRRPHAPLSYGYYAVGYTTPMTLEVAKAVEQDRPLAAREIYQLHAERLIDRRGRENYRTASAFLGKIRDLYDRMDQYEAWTAYLTGLREKYRTLRALKEEMAAAGLLD